MIKKQKIIIANKYEIHEKIGNGSFGSIYQGINQRTYEKVAIKVEPVEYNLKLLKNESILYQYLKDVKGIPNVKWFGKDQINYYMVIPLLGDSLNILKKKFGAFSLHSIIQIGLNILQLIETIHEKGLIHRDIKPDNFLFGIDSNQLYLIDFGFCKSYFVEKEHIPFKNIHKIIGSPNFVSIHTHDHITQSRRDDLESFGYILYYLYYGDFEWSNVSLTNDLFYEKNNKEMKKMKMMINEKNDLPDFLKKIFIYVRQMYFEEKPDYLFIRNLMVENL